MTTNKKERCEAQCQEGGRERKRRRYRQCSRATHGCEERWQGAMVVGRSDGEEL